MSDDIDLSRVALLMCWMDLGGYIELFEQWMSEPRRSLADARAQLMAAKRGWWPLLFQDTNPPAGELLDLYLEVPR